MTARCEHARLIRDGLPLAASGAVRRSGLRPVAVSALHDKLAAGAVTLFGPRLHLALVHSGVVDLTEPSGTWRAEAGQLVIVPPGRQGFVTAVTDAECFVVLMGEGLVDDLVRWALPSDELRRAVGPRAAIRRVALDDATFTRFESVFRRAVGAIGTGTRLRAVSEAVGLLARAEPFLTGQELAEPPTLALRREVAEASRLLAEQHAHPWTVPELAARVGLSPSALTRAFRAGLGVTPAAYLRQVRLHRFMDYLAWTGISVQDAAARVGWSAPSHARALMVRRHGMAPSQFRAQHRSRRDGPPAA